MRTFRNTLRQNKSNQENSEYRVCFAPLTTRENCHVHCYGAWHVEEKSVGVADRPEPGRRDDNLPTQQSGMHRLATKGIRALSTGSNMNAVLVSDGWIKHLSELKVEECTKPLREDGSVLIGMRRPKLNESLNHLLGSRYCVSGGEFL